MSALEIASAHPRAWIVSEVCFLRESLGEILTRSGFIVCGQLNSLADALAQVHIRPDVVLLDAAFPTGVRAAKELAAALPEASLVVLAIAETEENVLAWAEAGIAGYVPNTASVTYLVSLIEQIRRGEPVCSARIVGSLLRRIGAGNVVAKQSVFLSGLTPREREISQLIATGLSNKAIARSLGISLATTKSHVHNLLGKLSVQGRSQLISRISAVR